MYGLQVTIEPSDIIDRLSDEDKKGAKIMSRFFDYGTNCEYCKHSDTELWDKPCNICDGAVNFEEEEDDNNVTQ